MRHCKDHYVPDDVSVVEARKHLLDMLDMAIEHGGWFEISDCSAWELREYIRELG